MAYFDLGQLSKGATAIGRMVQEHEEQVARLQSDLAAALARAEAAEAEAREAWFAFDRMQDRGNRLAADLEAALARVAELEAQLAAQGWRGFTEPPPIGEPIQIVTVIDAVREEPDGLYRIGHTSEWQTWRPAPQEPTP